MAKKQMKLGSGEAKSVSSMPFHDETRWREVLKALGTLQNASRIAGVTDDQIAKWRDGRAKAPLSIAATLCYAAGFSLDWLATGEGPKSRNSASEPPRYDPGLMRLAMSFARLAADQDAIPGGMTEQAYATALFERITGIGSE